ncbi:MAG: helix-turn-helix transcriptional regulator [Planctomycetota bacterium]
MSATVRMVGIDTPQNHAFVHAHPGGLGDWSFLHFRSEAELLTEQGRQVVQPGGCIVLDERFPHWHRGHAGPLRTDWLIAVGDGVPGLAARYELPVNRLVYPSTTGVLHDCLAAMVSERLRGQVHAEERLRLLLEDCFLLIARGIREAVERGGGSLEERLGRLREQVHSRLDRDWTLVEMAQRVGMSRNHFCHRYRQVFNVSPVEDLLRARIRQACVLLARGGHSVGDCARMVGFCDAPWFSRCFRRRMGCSPRDFARDPDALRRLEE